MIQSYNSAETRIKQHIINQTSSYNDECHRQVRNISITQVFDFIQVIFTVFYANPLALFGYN